MNIYFLVEGTKTEMMVYPQWLRFLAPQLSQVKFYNDANENNYFLISGMGSPRLLTHELARSVDEINDCDRYDYLVLVIDADDMSEDDKIIEINKFITDRNISLNPKCNLHIIIQKYCIETWFLGNRAAYTRSPDNHGEFYRYANFFDVSQQDPESMNKPEWFVTGSISVYHEKYLKKMLAEKNIRYSKANPKEVGGKPYLAQLQKRVSNTQHLSSLRKFFNFCEIISQTSRNALSHAANYHDQS